MSIHHESFCLSCAWTWELLFSRLSYAPVTFVFVFIVDDPYTVADKWLLKENLPLTYRQQVVEFILQNSGQNNFVPDPSFRDPYTGGKHVVFSFGYCYIFACWLLLLTTKFILYQPMHMYLGNHRHRMVRIHYPCLNFGNRAGSFCQFSLYIKLQSLTVFFGLYPESWRNTYLFCR